MAGWAAGRLLEAAAGLIGAVAEGSEAAVRIGAAVESRLVPGIERAVAAIEAWARRREPARPAPEVDAVRRAIAEGRWTRAERPARRLRRDHPHAPRSRTLTAELSAAQRRRGRFAPPEARRRPRGRRPGHGHHLPRRPDAPPRRRRAGGPRRAARPVDLPMGPTASPGRGLGRMWRPSRRWRPTDSAIRTKAGRCWPPSRRCGGRPASAPAVPGPIAGRARPAPIVRPITRPAPPGAGPDPRGVP